MSLDQAAPSRQASASAAPALRRIAIRGRVVPVWLVLALVYVASRVLSTGILAAASAFGAGFASTSHQDFLGYLESWDGLHYRHIAEFGYPQRLPIDAAGTVEKNPWAFLPLYPLLARALMMATGMGFAPSAVILSLALGGAATFALHRILLQRFGGTGAMWGAIFFCCGPMSFLFDVAYADALFAFCMFCSVLAMMSRRWLLMIPFAVAAAFAHPGAIALSLAIALVCLRRLVSRKEKIGVREWWAAGFAAVVIAVAGIAWPIIAGVATGDASAYFDTETAWWHDYIGHVSLVPFSPWFIFGWHYAGVAGVAMMALVVGSFAWWLTTRSARRLGPDLRAYVASYAAYLVAVFLPQQSAVRMLLPLSPLLGHPALTATPVRRYVTLGACLLLQPFAVLLLWATWPP